MTRHACWRAAAAGLHVAVWTMAGLLAAAEWMVAAGLLASAALVQAAAVWTALAALLAAAAVVPAAGVWTAMPGPLDADGLAASRQMAAAQTAPFGERAIRYL